MKFTKTDASVFVPDGTAVQDAFCRVTHLGIGAHQDDLEIMAFHGIQKCFTSKDLWFGAVIVDRRRRLAAGRRVRRFQRRSHGRAPAHRAEEGGHPRQLRRPRPAQPPEPGGQGRRERAGSGPIWSRSSRRRGPRSSTPTIRPTSTTPTSPSPSRPSPPCASCAPDERPTTVYGCEVWRELDWMDDSDKVPLDVGRRESLSMGAHRRLRLPDRGRQALRPGHGRPAPGQRHLFPIARDRRCRTALVRHGPDAARPGRNARRRPFRARAHRQVPGRRRREDQEVLDPDALTAPRRTRRTAMEIIIQPDSQQASQIAAAIVARIVRTSPTPCSAWPPATPRSSSTGTSSACTGIRGSTSPA